MNGPIRSSHLRAARIVAAVSVVIWVGVFFGLIDLSVTIDETPGFYDLYLLDTGWGVLYTFLVGGGFVALTVRPRATAPLAQLAVVALALVVTAVAAGSWPQLVPAALLGLTCAAVGALSSSWADLRPLRFDPFVAIAAAVMAAPAAWAAVVIVIRYRQRSLPVDDETWDIAHWPTQAALAISVAAVSFVVAAGVRARWSGTAVSAACVAVAAAWFGWWSAVYPEHSGSAGRPGGVALVAWAVTFLAVVALRFAADRTVRDRGVSAVSRSGR